MLRYELKVEARVGRRFSEPAYQILEVIRAEAANMAVARPVGLVSLYSGRRRKELVSYRPPVLLVMAVIKHSSLCIKSITCEKIYFKCRYGYFFD